MDSIQTGFSIDVSANNFYVNFMNIKRYSLSIESFSISTSLSTILKSKFYGSSYGSYGQKYATYT